MAPTLSKFWGDENPRNILLLFLDTAEKPMSGGWVAMVQNPTTFFLQLTSPHPPSPTPMVDAHGEGCRGSCNCQIFAEESNEGL